MRYQKKAPMVRIDKSLDDYLVELSKRSGLGKVKTSMLLVKELRKREKKRLGFKFDLKI